MKNRSDRSLGLFFEAWCVVSFSIFKLLRSLHDFVGFFSSCCLFILLSIFDRCVYFFSLNLIFFLVSLSNRSVWLSCVAFRPLSERTRERTRMYTRTHKQRTTRNDRKYKLNNNLNVLWGHSHYSFCSKLICRCVLLLRCSFHTSFFFSARSRFGITREYAREFAHIQTDKTYFNSHIHKYALGLFVWFWK